MNLISEWAGGDLTEGSGWKFFPAVYFECNILDIDRVICDECIQYVIYGDAFDEQVEKMLQEIPCNDQGNYQVARREFINICQYFLFFVAFEPITTPSRLTKKVSASIGKAGAAEVIDMWRCWTPNQLPLLKGNLPKVMFLSAPSTGKTALMEAKAFQAMQNGLNVLFLLPFAKYNVAKTLLTLKMQQQWQNLKEKHDWQNELHVCSVRREGSYSKIDFEVLHCRILKSFQTPPPPLVGVAEKFKKFSN